MRILFGPNMLRGRVIVMGLANLGGMVNRKLCSACLVKGHSAAAGLRSCTRTWFRFLLYDRTGNFTTNSALCSKIFRETENSFAHQVMEGIPAYKETLLCRGSVADSLDDEEFRSLLRKDWRGESAEAVYSAFERISHYEQNTFSISDELFDNICQALMARCKEMTDCQLIGTLACLLEWPPAESLNARNFSALWSALDKECVQRYKLWDRSKLLLVADHWYRLHLARVCEFMWHSNWRLGRKPSSLTPAQLVQTMFYMNSYRKIHPSISMYEFEYSFEQCIDSLSLHEIGIMSMGFFKTQTKIRSSNLLYKMMERTLKEVDTVGDITLSAILKVLRGSVPAALGDMLYELQDRMLPRIEQVSLLSCMHIALAGTNTLVFHQNVLTAIAQRFSREIKDVRLKDLERLAFVLTLFNYDPRTEPCIFKLIEAELNSPERKEEFRTYPKCFPRCLYYLTLKNIILEDQIAQVLHPDFISEVYNKNMYFIDRELLCLDVIMEVERPQYSGSRLPAKARNLLTKKFVQLAPKKKKSMTAFQRMFVEIVETLGLMFGGEQFYFICHVLPHYEQPDLVFCVSQSGQPVQVPRELREVQLTEVKYPPASDLGRWCCLVVCGWNSYMKNTGQLLGSTAFKIHMLRTMGYCPILVMWHEWMEVSLLDRERFIRSKIEAAFQESEIA